MADAAYVFKKVDEKERDVNWSEMLQRMDDDYKIWNLEPTEDDDHPGVINITSPDPRSFADELQKGLVRSERAISIHMAELEGSDERDNISKLERLFEFCLERADLYLFRRGLIPLKDSLVWSAMVRGYSVVRILNYFDKNKNFIPNYLQLDPRWLTYEYGEDGLAWVAHKTFRSKGDLGATYGYDTKATSTAIIDFWQKDGGRVVETVCAPDKELRVNKYKLDELPFIIVPMATRPPVVDEAGLRMAGYADSIYAAGRSSVPQRNKMRSLLATWANIRAKAPTVHEKVDGSQDIDTIIMEPDRVINLAPGEKLYPIPLNEISATLIQQLGMQDAEWQRATAPYVVFGDVKMPSSGTSIESLKEAIDKAYFLCLTNLDTIYTRICYMIEEQIKAQKLKLDVKGVGKDKKYYEDKITVTDIKRPHIIKAEHIIKSRFGELQSLEMAQMAKLIGIPDEISFEKYLNMQDPKRIMELSAIQNVERHPAMQVTKALKRALVEGRTDDARFFATLLEQTLTPQGGQEVLPREPRPIEPATPVRMQEEVRS